MKEQQGEPEPGRTPLVERLRRRYGSDLDPGISLGGAPRSDPPAEPSAPTGGVLQRLGLRAPLATRYRLERELARGGMGAILEVYDEDLRRHLAMKVALSRGGEGSSARAEELDPRVLVRFLEEAQVTGQLDHPGIVPVHELGLDENGHVYFTMRLVRGRDLEVIFRLVAEGREGWSLPRALGVLLKACEALAYAHKKGVVHRDLKPANVMVGSFGEVYVMDWGLARVLGQAEAEERAGQARAIEPRVATDRREDISGSADEELYTMQGDVLGTPAYMAPEQARGQLDALDARTDVYSMGAMLYRLLAGTRPYVAPGEQPRALELIERVRGGPPTPLEQLAPAVPAELVAICERAMAREPAARYPDMLALGEDLRAFLEGRVVRAYETGAVAEARKWVRRNKPLAASLAAGVLALASGLVASLALKARADTSASLAEERRLAADESAADARLQARIAEEVNDFLNFDLLASVAPEERGRDVTVREVLDASAARLEGRFPDEPLVEAQLRTTIGRSYERLGGYESARPQLERALELTRQQLGPRATETIELMRQVASVWADLGRAAEAAKLYGEALALCRTSFGEDSKETLSTANDLGIVLVDLGRFEEARGIYEETLAAEQRLLGDDHADTVATRTNLGLVLQELGELQAAYELLVEVLAHRRRVLGPRHRLTMESLQNLSIVCTELGRLAESEELQREATGIAVELLGPEHPDTGRARSTLGSLYMQQGRVVEAEEELRLALAALEEQLGREHPETLLVANNLCILLAETGRAADALPMRRAILEAQRQALGPEHPEVLSSQNALALILMQLGRHGEAEELLRATLEVRHRTLGPEHPTTIAETENLGNVLYSRGDVAGSRELVLEVLDARERVLGPEHPATARTMMNLGLLEKVLGNTEEAAALLEEALARSRAALGDAHPDVAQALRELGAVRLAAGVWDEAAELYRESAAVRRELAPDDAEVGYLLHQAGYALSEAGRREEAVVAFEDAVAVRRGVLGEEHQHTMLSLYMLGRELLAVERFEEAEEAALEFHDRRLEAVGPDHAETVAARKLLADLYEAWGRPDEAAVWR